MRFSRIQSRVSSSGACFRTTSSKVCLASSIIAHSSPSPVSIPADSNSAGSTWRSVLPSSGSPSESASRLAGSMVSTATRRPRAAIPAAIAAEVVVFPTPPDPAQMHTRLPSSSSATPAISALDLLGERLDLLHADLGLEQEGQGRDRRGTQLLEPGELLALDSRPAALAHRGAASGAHRAVVLHRIEAFDLLGSEALGVQAVHVDPVHGHADLVAELGLQVRGLVHRHLLWQRDDCRPGVVVVADEPVERLGL